MSERRDAHSQRSLLDHTDPVHPPRPLFSHTHFLTPVSLKQRCYKIVHSGHTVELRMVCADTLGFPILHSFGPVLTNRVETEVCVCVCVCVCDGEGCSG